MSSNPIFLWLIVTLFFLAALEAVIRGGNIWNAVYCICAAVLNIAVIKGVS